MALDVQHDETAHKFYSVIEGHEAHVTYHPVGDRTYDLQHTFVPPELRGRKIAGDLVRQALDQTMARGFQFIPTCPFIKSFVEKNPEYQKGVAAH